MSGREGRHDHGDKGAALPWVVPTGFLQVYRALTAVLEDSVAGPAFQPDGDVRRAAGGDSKDDKRSLEPQLVD